MNPSDERIRLEIAFTGGHVVGLMTSPRSAEALDQGLAAAAAAGGIVAVESDEGVHTVVLQHVVYVKRFARESRVGFGSG